MPVHFIFSYDTIKDTFNADITTTNAEATRQAINHTHIPIHHSVLLYMPAEQIA